MSKDSVWKSLKKDETKVYGEPIMDAFLKVVDNIEPRHMRDLDGRQKGLLKPEARLNASETVEEAKAAMKDGARGLNAAAWHAGSRGNLEVLKMLFDLKRDDADTVAAALSGASKSGPIDVVRYIVDRARSKGVTVEKEDSIALSYAAVGRRREVFEYLYDQGFGFGLDAEHMLTLAIRAGSIGVAKKEVHGVEEKSLIELIDFATRMGRRDIVDMMNRELERTEF